MIAIGVFLATRHIYRDLARGDQHPLRESTENTAERSEAGGFSAGP